MIALTEQDIGGRMTTFDVAAAAMLPDGLLSTQFPLSLGEPGPGLIHLNTHNLLGRRGTR